MAADAPDEREPALDVITVTAQKFETNQQSTPISIVVMTGDMLQQNGVTRAQELGTFIPNLRIDGATNSGGNSATFSIRGVGTFRSSPTSQNTVAVYVDDVFMPGFEAGALDLLDVDQVEVLRGPQGTLFGRNAVAGAIHYISRAPDFSDFSGSARVTAGEMGRRELHGSLNVPFSDTFAARFSGMYSHTGGYVRATYNDSKQGAYETYGGRAFFRFEPADSLSFDLLVDHIEAEREGALSIAQFDDNFVNRTQAGAWIGGGAGVGFRAWTNSGTGSFNLIENSPGFATVTGLTTGQCGPLGLSAPCIFSLATGPYSTLGGTNAGSRIDNTGVAFKINWDITDDLLLRSISGWRQSDSTTTQDADDTPFSIQENSRRRQFENFSQELQMIWTADPFTFVGGLFYYNEDSVETVEDSRFGDPVFDDSCSLSVSGANYTFTGCTRDAYTADGRGQISLTDVNNRSLAAFANLTVPLTDIFEVVLGARYTEDRQQLYFENEAGNFNTANLAGTTFKEGVFTPRAVLNAQVTPDIFVYASYSQGYRQGGVNARQGFDSTGALIQELVPPFASEQNDAYELGAKLDFWSGRGRLNMAYYIYDYRDLQTTAAPPGDTQGFEQNAATARISGFEADLNLAVTDELTLNASVGTVAAKYTEIGAGATQIALESGLPRAPEYSLTIGFNYERETALGTLGLTANYGYTAEQFSTPQDFNNLPSQPSGNSPLNALCTEVIPSLNRTNGCNGNQGVMPGYGILNTRLELTDRSDSWTAGVYCRNCLDEYYLTGLSAFGRQVPLASTPFNKFEPGRPREFGIDFEYRF